MPSVLANEDQPMGNVRGVEADNAADLGESLLDLNEQRIRVLSGASDGAASFEFEAEDHTLGNALRHIIMKNPGVEFCGYSIPHPSEPKMNIRIQTHGETTVYEVLEKGFDDLISLCDIVIDKFNQAKDEFNTSNRHSSF